ncbi:MAG: HAMP domain-containing protein [Deltaproteobacteria bacterium]|nr:HAMP domain-containing protein [Deltaproteobacteria bacterium]
MALPVEQVKALFSRIRRALGKSSTKDMIIGEVLKKKGLITKDQLETALKVQQDKLVRRGQVVRLGHIIVELGYASEEEVVKAINDHYQLSVTSLSDNIKELVIKVRGTFVERLPSPHVPIWLQFSIATILVILLTTIVINLVIFSRQKERLYRQTVRIGMVSLTYFADNARIPLLQDDILQLNMLIKNAAYQEELLYAVIVDNRHMIRAHTDHNMIGKAFSKIDNVKKISRKGDVTYFNYVLPDGKHVLNLTQAITFKDKQVGEVHVGVSIDFIEQLISKERSTVALIALAIIFFGIITAILLGVRFSRPISTLLQATEEFGRGNYQYKVSLGRNDELGNLAKAFNHLGEELWKNSLIQKSFGKYVGSEVLDMIAADPERVWLKGHRNEATVFFADIRGFTHYADTKEPEEVVEELNEYFEIATKAIIQFGGYVDKFIGDAILGVFGVPVYRQDHIERAVRAAIYLQHKLGKGGSDGNPLLGSIGIGIDSGIIVSGNIGSQVKMEYTVIGDCVNMASRLNGLAGPGEIIISGSVRENLSGMIALEELPPQEIKGKTGPVKIFKVLGTE